jgi:hypothetical protein
MGSPPVISSVQLQGHVVQGDLTIDLQGSRHLVLTGPNGSGKTTLLDALALAVDNDLFGGRPRAQLLDGLRRFGGTTGPWHQELARYTASATWSVSMETLSSRSKVDTSPLISRPSDVEGPKPAALSKEQLPRVASRFRDAFLQLLVNRHTTMLLDRAEGDPRWQAIRDELAVLLEGLRDSSWLRISSCASIERASHSSCCWAAWCVPGRTWPRVTAHC